MKTIFQIQRSECSANTQMPTNRVNTTRTTEVEEKQIGNNHEQKTLHTDTLIPKKA